MVKLSVNKNRWSKIQSNIEVQLQQVKRFDTIFNSVFTCSKLTIEALEQGVKYAQS